MQIEILAAALGLLAALRSKKKVNGVGRIDKYGRVIVNYKSNGRTLYQVGIWGGSGYLLDVFYAYSNNEEEALEYVVAYIEKKRIYRLFADDYVETLYRNGEDEDVIDSIALYVDATTVGAKNPHYILTENLQIRKA